jgi:serine phosphatase RsbU (regulator of sigma subunit)
VLAALLTVPVSALTLAAPSTMFRYGLVVMQALNIVLGIVYGRAIVAAVAKRRDGARLFLAGFAAIAFLSVGEIVAVDARLNIPRLSPIGMYLFICFQSILLAKRFNAAFVAAEASERDIRRLNAELREQEKTKLALAKVTAEKDMLQMSLAEAQDVYTSLGIGDAVTSGIAMSSFFNPAEVAGGDWLGVHFDKERQRLFLVIGDVTGHDLLSALVTIASAGTFKGAMATIAARLGAASMDECLSTLADAMNAAVRDSGRQDRRLMSVVMLGVDVATGEVSYLNAGHVPALMVSGSDVRAILAPANPLGLCDQAKIGRVRLRLAPGDGLFLYTDGLLDNEGPKGEKLRIRQLKRILSSESDPEQVRARLIAECQAVWQKKRPKDDCSFVYVKWQGSPSKPERSESLA